MNCNIARLDNLITDARRFWQSRRRSPQFCDRVFDFVEFMGESSRRGRAMVSFAASSLTRDALRGRSLYFNPNGAALEMARALNQLGYEVDVVDACDRDFIPDRQYHIFVGHANVNWRQISERLPERALRVTYMTGCYWRHFEEKTQACYRRFCASRNLPREAIPVCRKICLGEETAKTFRPVAKRVAPINNAAYLDVSPPGLPKDWETARRHFLYYGGAGNIQKGVDLLIEAFAQEPACHLHLYAPLEPEILKAYRRELAAPNIHYARPLRFLSSGFVRLLHRCAFTLLCGGFASGQSTALIGSLGYGLIPVVNREADIPFAHDQGIRIGANDVVSVREAILRASRMPPTWLDEARRHAFDNFQKYFVPDAFRRSFQEAVERALKRID
jgi:glycosyltransferase involved in cell wall biosynthesis